MNSKEIEKLNVKANAIRGLEEHIRQKEIEKLNDKANAIREFDEHIRQKEMETTAAETYVNLDSKIMNNADYPTDEEVLSPKKR